MRRTLIATATFGLEAVVRREIEALGYEVLATEDGKVTYAADERGVVRSNLHLRCADRVFLRVAEFEAADFEELFQRTRGLAWEEIIPLDGRFTVTCTTVKSKLSSEPACQRTVKKAVASRLQEFYVQETMPETGAEYTIRLTLRKDRATLAIDTSGRGLHRRGYRVADTQAPIKETLAAALVQLSFWKEGRTLIDPCCGSGTIPIEAAMIRAGIAPGLSRSFASEDWEMIDGEIWKEERRKAFGAIRLAAEGPAGDGKETDRGLEGAAETDPGRSGTGTETVRGPESAGCPSIRAMDIDPRAIAAAKENALEAGVDESIGFRQIAIGDWVNSLEAQRQRRSGSDARGSRVPGSRDLPENAVIVTNLPYGHRIGDRKGIEGIYGALRRLMEGRPDISVFIITSDKELEKALGRKADRRRKLYNGNIETTYYQFHGEKPGRANRL